MASSKTESLMMALSQPHSLHLSFIRDEDERPNVGHDEFSDQIPVISLADIDDTSGEKRASVRREVAAACEEWGIFQVVDHGIDEKVLDEMTQLAHQFFALPREEKLRLDMSGGKKGGFIVSNHLQGDPFENWREMVTFFSYPVNSRDYSLWPETPSGWRSATEAYCEALMGLAAKLLEVLSEAMDLPPDSLAKACIQMEQKVVVNFYPKCPHPNLTLGLKRHTDPGTITLLLQDHVGGLQATKDGGRTWITVQPVKGAFVVNLGDHGYYLSNGRFKSADHRAVVNSSCNRLSIAAFQHPNADAIVYPLKMRPGEEAIVDEAITYSEMYRRKMSKDVELARIKKLAKEKKQKEQELEG